MPEIPESHRDLLNAPFATLGTVGPSDLRNMDRDGERRTVVTINLTRVRAVDMREPDSVGSTVSR